MRADERSEPAGNLRDLVIITGMSGAGKSAAMAMLRGRRLFLRRQPAAGDDLVADRPLQPHGLARSRWRRSSRDARGGSYFDEIAGRRRGSQSPAARSSRSSSSTPTIRRSSEPLQGDAPPPPACAAGRDRRGHRRRARDARADPRTRGRGDRHDRALAGTTAPRDRGGFPHAGDPRQALASTS